MAWPYLPSTVKVVVTYTIGGKLAINVHFAQLTAGGSPSAADLVNIADAAHTSWSTHWKSAMATSVEVTDIEAINWEVANGRISRPSFVLPIVGTSTGSVMPANVALVTSLKTNFRGRDKIGRQYLLGFVEEEITGNNASAALVTAANDLFTNYQLNLGAVGAELGVYSLYENGVQRVTPKFTKATVIATNSRVDTQRRRLP